MKNEKTRFGIALLKKNNNVVGLRVLETDFEKGVKIENKSFKDLAGEELFNVAVSKKGEIKTIAREDITEKIIKDGKRSNKLDNYPVVNLDTKKIENNTFLILCRTTQGKQEGFALTDASGRVSYVSEKEAVKILNGDAKKIANGTIKNGNTISAVVGYYKRVEKLGIVSKVDKEWDLSNNKKELETNGMKYIAPTSHLMAINKNYVLKNKIDKEMSIKVLEQIFKEDDKKKVEAMKKMFHKNDTKRLAEFLTGILEKYDNIFNNCENGEELKKGIARMMQGLLKDDTYLEQVKECMKEKTKIKDYFEKKAVKN